MWLKMSSFIASSSAVPQSALICAARTIFVQRSRSVSIIRARSSGLPGVRIQALLQQAVANLRVGEDRVHLGIEQRDLLLRQPGAGASIAYQMSTSMSVTPSSASEGTSGVTGERCAPPAASMRSLPACTCAKRDVHRAETSPAPARRGGPSPRPRCPCTARA